MIDINITSMSLAVPSSTNLSPEYTISAPVLASSTKKTVFLPGRPTTFSTP